MKEKKNETIPIGLVVGLLAACTVAAGLLALGARGLLPGLEDLGQRLGRSTAPQEQQVQLSSVQEDWAPEEPEPPVEDPALTKLANTYGESLGLLVGEGAVSLSEDKYCPDALYQVEYPDGVVQLRQDSGAFYWFSHQGVKTGELRLSETQLTRRAREYLAILQLPGEYSAMARRMDRERGIMTVIFQRSYELGEELELASDYEAVKLRLSAQGGELLSCKVFDLPLVEQEGQPLSESKAVAAVKDQEQLDLGAKAQAELCICSPIVWGDEANYTSRVVWKVTIGEDTYFADAYSGSLLGRL